MNNFPKPVKVCGNSNKVMPLSFDDTLSYMEMTRKVVDYMNECVKTVNKIASEFNAVQASVGDLNIIKADKRYVDSLYNLVDRYNTEIRDNLREIEEDLADEVSDLYIAINNLVGHLENLNTTDKSNIVNAVNEVNSVAMRRYILRLERQSDGAFVVKDYSSGAVVDFDTLFTRIRTVNEYAVCLYGNSKLRPQYVSQNEIMFIGLDRASSEAKVLRLLVTPSRVSYEMFALASKDDIKEEVFVAEYGVTTLAEIRSAHNSGKVVIANNGNNSYRLDYLDNTKAQFSNFLGTGEYAFVFVNTANMWFTAINTGFQPLSDKVTTINEYSTDEEYPSAKAVWNLTGSKNEGVFVAEFNVTNFADVKNAYNSGKVVVAKYGAFVFNLTQMESTYANFTGFNTRDALPYAITVNSSNTWDIVLFRGYEFETNKVDVINEYSTNEEYPSAKAVWNLTGNKMEFIGDYSLENDDTVFDIKLGDDYSELVCILTSLAPSTTQTQGNAQIKPMLLKNGSISGQGEIITMNYAVRASGSYTQCAVFKKIAPNCFSSETLNNRKLFYYPEETSIRGINCYSGASNKYFGAGSTLKIYGVKEK